MIFVFIFFIHSTANKKMSIRFIVKHKTPFAKFNRIVYKSIETTQEL